jgi:Na+/proline symporter
MTAIVTFTIYLAIVFLIAILANRAGQSKSFVNEYFLGSRNIGLWAFAFTYAATAASGGTFMGFPSLIYTHGWVLAWWIAGYMIAPMVALGLLPCLRETELVEKPVWSSCMLLLRIILCTPGVPLLPYTAAEL